MSILNLPHAAPAIILFDWHATLVDTHDAMYLAIDDVLPRLQELGLTDRLIKPEDSKTIEDAKLVKYVQENLHLHPKIKEAKKISRTDIFEVLFGSDEEAKHIAHIEFAKAYRNHFGHVTPFEKNLRATLTELRNLGIVLGVLTNRDREFMLHELAVVDSTGWLDLFATVVCGDDVEKRKPAPDSVLKAIANVNGKVGSSTWYVGDSTTDVIAAKEAGVTAIFYNGARWSTDWIDKIFPDTIRHPHRPDAVVNSCVELLAIVKKFLQRNNDKSVAL